MKGLLIIGSVFFLTNVYAQKNDIWILKSDSLNLEYVGYVDRHNNVKIPFSKYAICFTDTLKTYAVVLKSGEGFVAIDKQENKLFTIYPFGTRGIKRRSIKQKLTWPEQIIGYTRV